MRTTSLLVLALSIASGACIFNPDASGNPGGGDATPTPDCNLPRSAASTG